MMRPSIIFDSSYFAVPGGFNNSDQVVDLYASINDWADRIVRQNVCNFLIGSDTIETLSSIGCYPAVESIDALLELFDLQEVFSSVDLSSRLLFIMSRCENVADVIGYEVITLCECDVEGANLSSCRDAPLVEDFKRNCSTIAHSNSSDYIRLISGIEMARNQLNCRSRVSTFRDKEGKSCEQDTNMEIEAIIHCVKKPMDFIISLDAQKIIERAEEPELFHLAITLQIISDLSISCDKLPLDGVHSFTIGSEFKRSLDRHGIRNNASYQNSVLRRSAEAVTGISGVFVRDFGKTRRRDGAAARRLHVTKSGIGLRLMFWSKDGSGPELANVGPKNELVIEEGTDCFEGIF